MNTILEQYKDKINGTFSFFGRIIIKGHIWQFFSPSGKKYFLSQKDILLKDFSSYANQATNGIVAHVEEFTASRKRPLIYLTSAKIPKKQTALAILDESPVGEGLICTLSVVGYCQTLKPVKKSDGRLELSTVNRKCKYYYFYFLVKTSASCMSSSRHGSPF